MPQLAAQTMPSADSPSPACANIVPQAERGRPIARCAAVASGTRNTPARSRSSTIEADNHENAEADPQDRDGVIAAQRCGNSGADRGEQEGGKQPLTCGERLPRFQASSGPYPIATRIGTKSGPMVVLKNGAPTEIFAP